MQWNRSYPHILAAGVFAVCAISNVPGAIAQLNSGEPQLVSTGQRITPLAPAGASFQALNPHLADNPGYTVGQAVTTAVSPDGKTLLKAVQPPPSEGNQKTSSGSEGSGSSR